MDEMAAIRVFVQVVEAGSLSSTARQNHGSISSVARQVKWLEQSLGARLLNKTTRNQSLTEAGQVFYAHAKSILEDIDRAKREVSSYQGSVKGLLRVYLRTSAATAVIVPELPRFLQQYPGLHIDVVLGDERIDLVSNAIDVAVWLGHLEDSSMIARRLSASQRVVCGSPQYFQRCGIPKQPADLARHNCLVYKAPHYGNIWRFTKGGKRIDVTVTGNLQSSSGSVLMAAALGGLGLMVAQKWMVINPLSTGALVSVLRDYDVSPTDNDTALYVVFPHSKGLSPKARAFIDYLVELF